MTSSVKPAPFHDNADRYWGKGIIAVPVKPGTKQPSIPKWTSYQANMPSPARRQEWREKYGRNGIRILTGTEVVSGHQLAALDVDDDRLVRMVRDLVGNCPSAKRGKKGETVFVLMPGSDKLKSTTFKGQGGLGNVDVLAGGRFTVNPPTIHPDTNEPYVCTGQDIADCDLDTLPVIDKRKFKVINKAVSSENTAALVSGKATHEPGVAFVAQMLAAQATDDEIKAVIRGLLPEDYTGNSLDELQEWIDSAREKGFDQPAQNKSKKDKQSSVALELVRSHGIELFKTQLSDAFASIPMKEGGRTCHPLRSSSLANWVRFIYFSATGKPLAANALSEVVESLDAEALFQSPTQEVHVRFAEYEGSVYIDPGREDGKLVRITNAGWDVVANSPIRFWRPSGYGEMPLPEQGGELSEFQGLLGLDELNYKLVVAFLLNCLNPKGPYMSLLVQGRQGSGKSLLARLLKLILDPCVTEKLRLPATEHDLAIQASQQRLLNYDNTSSIKWDMSDALRTLLTGGAFSTRKYYTDNESRTFRYMRPIIMNGIGEFANRPDFLERSIQLDLPTMPRRQRRSERELNTQF